MSTREMIVFDVQKIDKYTLEWKLFDINNLYSFSIEEKGFFNDDSLISNFIRLINALNGMGYGLTIEKVKKYLSRFPVYFCCITPKVKITSTDDFEILGVETMDNLLTHKIELARELILEVEKGD